MTTGGTESCGTSAGTVFWEPRFAGLLSRPLKPPVATLIQKPNRASSLRRQHISARAVHHHVLVALAKAATVANALESRMTQSRLPHSLG